MKYIRKEITKGIQPIADQNLKITGDVNITGNYLQNTSKDLNFGNIQITKDVTPNIKFIDKFN